MTFYYHGCDYYKEDIKDDDTFTCVLYDLKAFTRNYLDYPIFLMTILVVFISLKIGKSYTWFILNQTVFHIIHILMQHFSRDLSVLSLYLGKFVYYTLVFNIRPRWTYVSLLLLVGSRFFGMFFPYSYERIVNKKSIFFIIFAWNLMFFVPTGIWDYLYAMTSWVKCPEYSADVCDSVNPYFINELDANIPKYYKPQYLDMEKMKNVGGINYELCFSYQSCKAFRLQINPTVSNIVITVLTLSSIILSILLFSLLLIHLKSNSSINKTTAIASLKISIMLFLQSSFLFFCLLFRMADIVNKNFANIFPNYFIKINDLFKDELHVIYIFMDYLLILFLLNDYRNILFSPITKFYKTYLSKKNRVEVLSGNRSSVLINNVRP